MVAIGQKRIVAVESEQSGDQMVNKWRTYGAQNGAQNGDQMVTKWQPNGEQMETEWRPNGEHMVPKTATKMVTKMANRLRL